jgi:hypothetical protein
MTKITLTSGSQITILQQRENGEHDVLIIPDKGETLMATKKEKITEAADYISASPAADGNGWIYLAEETSEWYRVTETELIDLYDLLHSDDAETQRDAYSLWAGSTGECIGKEAEARNAGLLSD